MSDVLRDRAVGKPLIIPMDVKPLNATAGSLEREELRDVIEAIAERLFRPNRTHHMEQVNASCRHQHLQARISTETGRGRDASTSSRDVRATANYCIPSYRSY
jgi:hypothetical protein